MRLMTFSPISKRERGTTTNPTNPQCKQHTSMYNFLKQVQANKTHRSNNLVTEVTVLQKRTF